jgi:WD40 repeat protein
MSEQFNSNGRLDSWKEIAAYLRRDERTAKRWERNGLPVHRVPGGKRQAIFAYGQEIDDWLSTGAGNRDITDDVDDSEQTSTAQAMPKDQPSIELIPSMNIGWNSRLKTFTLVALLGMVGAVTRFSMPESSLEVTGAKLLTNNSTLKTGLVTDGSNLYFSESGNGKFQIATMPINGGPIRHIPTPFPKALVQDISQGSGQLLVIGRYGIEAEGSLWIVPLADGPPRKVGNVEAHSAIWSPDGTALVYANGNRIFLSLDGGASSRELHSFDSVPYELHWSKSGNRLQFLLRDAAAESTPWVIEFGPSFEVRSVSRAPFPVESCCNAWAEAFGYEFFSSRGRNNSRISVFPHHPAWWQQIPRTPELTTQLGIMSNMALDERTRRLFVLGGQPEHGEFLRFEAFSENFSSFLPGVSGIYLDFSKDGEWITYSGYDDDAVWISRADGLERKQLTFPPMEVELPRWSPDGAQIAFTARSPGKPWRIFVVSRHGGPPREVSSGHDNQGAPTWSPDGKWLAYANVACQESKTCAVHRIELATGKIETVPDSKDLRTARWSPDGRYIAALQPERHELLVFDVETKNWRKLADSINGDDLSWSRDSRYLYTSRPAGDRPEVVRIPVAGGGPQTIVNLKSLSKLNGKFDAGFCIAPDGSVILVRLITSSEIYAFDWKTR